MIQLQERDWQIPDTSYEQHFLRMDQIHRYLFPGATDRRARQRILELEQAELIRREEHFLLKGRSLIRLTKFGVAVAEERRAMVIPQRKNLDARVLIHDGIVTSVRLRLRELWDGTWVPESLIKSEEFPHIPDGMVVFPNGHQVAIEVENTPKGPERFHEIQTRWRGVPVRLVLWDELEAGAPKVWTIMGEIDLFARRTL